MSEPAYKAYLPDARRALKSAYRRAEFALVGAAIDEMNEQGGAPEERLRLYALLEVIRQEGES